MNDNLEFVGEIMIREVYENELNEQVSIFRCERNPSDKVMIRKEMYD